MDLEVFVQHVPGRPAWERMKKHLEASDVGQNYTLHAHPAGVSMKQNFLLLLTRMSKASSPYVLRLEDDCSDVNLHLKWNLLRWPALRDPRFGIGWGLRLGGGRKLEDRWHRGLLHASLCTLFRTRDLPEIVRRVRENNEPQDLAMTRAICDMDRFVCIHGPSLVENDIHTKSAVGSVGHTPQNHTSCGTFDKHWRR